MQAEFKQQPGVSYLQIDRGSKQMEQNRDLKLVDTAHNKLCKRDYN